MIDNKILFPEYLDWHQHSFAAWMSQKKDLDNLCLFLKSIFDDTKKKSCHTTLISGEAFENFLVDTHLALEFEELAKSLGYSDIHWIFVYRKPIEYLESIYAERSSYGVVLDISIMANIILEYGYVSPSSKFYNNKFVFDVRRFAKLFQKNVNKNLTIIKFEDFIEGFVGKTLLNHFVFQKNSLDVLSYEAKKIGVVRKRPSLEKVEFRYVANFLNMRPHKEFYESNKTLINALLPHRINIYKSVIEDIRFKFDEQFQEK